MANTKTTGTTAPIATDKPDTEVPAGVGVQTAASPSIDRDPAEIDKTLKKDAVKVKDGTSYAELDPHYGQGGAYFIDDDGIRKPMPQ